jgi:hypothetical protein
MLKWGTENLANFFPGWYNLSQAHRYWWRQALENIQPFSYELLGVVKVA